jgi:hypothetical protein
VLVAKWRLPHDRPPFRCAGSRCLVIAASPPLYRDALSSVLSFLTLRELSAALSVSREWTAAEHSMRPSMLTANISSHELAALLASQLRRHVCELGQTGANGEYKLTVLPDQLTMLTRALPQLRSLSATLDVPPGVGPLLFPARLQRLGLRLLHKPSDVHNCSTALLSSISQLQQLRTLRLQLHSGSVSLVPLQQLPLLRELELCVFGGYTLEKFAAELRGLPLLHRLRINTMGSTNFHRTALLRALLREEPEEQLRTLQWRDFTIVGFEFNDELTPLLLRLHSLERLEAMLAFCTRFDFLAALPQLTSLELHLPRMPDDSWRHLLSVFTSDGLTRLHSLELHGGPCSGDDLVKLLSPIPSLTCLLLDGLRAVDSLVFLRQLPTLASTLTRLTIQCTISWRLTAMDLPSLHVLQQLRELRLLRWLRKKPHRLTPADLAPFEQRPCAVLPQLEVFEWTTRL